MTYLCLLKNRCSNPCMVFGTVDKVKASYAAAGCAHSVEKNTEEQAPICTTDGLRDAFRDVYRKTWATSPMQVSTILAS